MQGLPSRVVPLRIVVSGDEALVEALSVRPDLATIAPAEGRLDIAARVGRAEVLIVDVGSSAAFAYEAIRSLTVGTPVLALISNDDVLGAVASGASGALQRDSPVELVLAGAAAVHAGLAVFDRSFVAHLVPAQTAPTPGAREGLTRREQEVLGLLAEGLSNKEIGTRLDISDHTAKFHVNSILQKMGAQKRVEAVVRAARLGIIDL